MDWFYNTEEISLPIPKHNRTIRKSEKILTVEVTIEEEDRLLTYIMCIHTNYHMLQVRYSMCSLAVSILDSAAVDQSSNPGSGSAL